MLPIALFCITISGPFQFSAQERIALDEMRSLGRDRAFTADLVSKRDGVAVPKAQILPAELKFVDTWFDRIVNPNERNDLAARDWRGCRTKSFENEVVEQSWQTKDGKFLWSDFEGNTVLAVRWNDEIDIQAVMAKVLNLPKNLPQPYDIFTQEKSGLTYGYAALTKISNLDAFLPEEKKWAGSIQYCVSGRLAIFRFSRPFTHPDSGGTGQLEIPLIRKVSRFDRS